MEYHDVLISKAGDVGEFACLVCIHGVLEVVDNDEDISFAVVGECDVTFVVFGFCWLHLFR